MVENQEDYIATPEQRQVDGLFRKAVLGETGTDLISSYFKDYQDRFNLDRDEAARKFVANAGWIANSHLDMNRDREKNQIFRQIRKALSQDIPRRKLVADMLSPQKGRIGEWVYQGFPESELREAYDRSELYP